jgi:very-short-patch-repair endonuclease
MSADSIYRRSQCGQWEHAFPSVYRMSGTPQSWIQRLTAAVLWAGDASVVCGRSAGASWGLDECPEGPIELIVTVRRCTPPQGISLRFTDRLVARDITTHRGLRITTVARTLLDLASVFQRDRLELVLEDALRKRMTAIPQLKDLLEGRGRGLPGAAPLRTLVERRDPNTRSTDTRFEAKLLALLRTARLPLPLPQFTITAQGHFIGRVDFAYPDHRLVIEAHSFRWHSGRKRWDSDVQREKDLRRLGWRILKITYDDLVERPDQVVADIRAAIGHNQLFA